MREAAAGLDAAQRGVRVTTSSADDAAAQLSGADAVLGELLDDVPVLTARLTYPLEARPADGAGATRSVVLAHVPDWATHVEIVTGRAPRAGGAAEVVAPDAAGLAAGSRLLVGSAGVPVDVVGTWEPVDPSDPLWFADPGLARGTMSGLKDAVGPLLAADDAAVNSAAQRPLVRWTVVPDVREPDHRPDGPPGGAARRGAGRAGRRGAPGAGRVDRRRGRSEPVRDRRRGVGRPP